MHALDFGVRHFSICFGMSRKHFSESGCIGLGMVEEIAITYAGVALKHSITASTAVKPSDSDNVLTSNNEEYIVVQELGGT